MGVDSGNFCADWRERTIRLVGEDAARRLDGARVAVFGLGGVGSYVAEALVRAGVGALMFVDGDTVEETNLNRQLIATRETLGMPKALAAKARALSINPCVQIDARALFYDINTQSDIRLSEYDYIADCIDTVTSKLLLIQNARAAGTPIISCMGAGNKLDPSRFEVAYIEQTSVCPLARVMRSKLGALGITRVKAVYSKEPPRAPADGMRAPASISFVPAAAGMVLAGEIARDLAFGGRA